MQAISLYQVITKEAYSALELGSDTDSTAGGHGDLNKKERMERPHFVGLEPPISCPIRSRPILGTRRGSAIARRR